MLTDDNPVLAKLQRLRDHHGYFTRRELAAIDGPVPVRLTGQRWGGYDAETLGIGCDHQGLHCPAWRSRTGVT